MYMKALIYSDFKWKVEQSFSEIDFLTTNLTIHIFFDKAVNGLENNNFTTLKPFTE